MSAQEEQEDERMGGKDNVRRWRGPSQDDKAQTTPFAGSGKDAQKELEDERRRGKEEARRQG